LKLKWYDVIVIGDVLVHLFKTPKGSAEITEDELSRTLVQGWSRATSYDSARWCEQNPALGQCAVSALIVQDLLGGQLLVGKVNGIEHYWNLLTDNRELDLTKHQFEHIESFEGPTYADRGYVLSFPNTRRRYRQLRRSVLAHLKAWSDTVREQKVSTRDTRFRQAS
jgi:hypothetical protein